MKFIIYIFFFKTSSAYSYTLAALIILEQSIENMMTIYLKNDMESFYTDLKELGETHIVDGKEFDYGEIFLYQADMNMWVTLDIYNGRDDVPMKMP